MKLKKNAMNSASGSVGDCFDIAMCESFFATLQCELLDRVIFRAQAQARSELFQFIEGWYNPHRLHSALGYSSTSEYEASIHNPPNMPGDQVSTKSG